MEETKKPECGICNAVSKCCCTKHKIIHILVWVLVGLALFCAGVGMGAKMGHFKDSRGYGNFENKAGCCDSGCGMIKGIRGGNGPGNCMGAVKPVTTSITTTGTIE